MWMSDDKEREKYLKGMQKYLEDLNELAKTNPEEAKKISKKALIDIGLIDENGNVLENGTPKWMKEQNNKDNEQ